jgi:hypothetical protein
VWVFLTASANAEAKKLKGAEIIKLLTGHTLVGPTDNPTAAQTVQAGGMLADESGDGQKLARWRVVGDKYGSAWDEKSVPKCADVIAEPPVLGFIGSDGIKNLWLIKR